MSQGVTLHLSVINRFPFFFRSISQRTLSLALALLPPPGSPSLFTAPFFFCSPVLLSPFHFGVMTASCHYHTSSSDHRANPTAALMTLPTERLSLGSAWTYFRCQFLFVFFYLFIRFLFLLFFFSVYSSQCQTCPLLLFFLTYIFYSLLIQSQISDCFLHDASWVPWGKPSFKH